MDVARTLIGQEVAQGHLGALLLLLLLSYCRGEGGEQGDRG